MDICIVDTRRQAKGVRGDFDKIFVLREVFRDTESSVSVPAGLDGTTTKARDQVIELLGELMDPKLLNSTHSHVFKKTGFKPASFSSLFELNIFSRFREYALFISLNEACSAIKALGTARSISIKSEVNGISDYVVKQFPGTEVLLLNKRKSKWQIAAEQYFLIAREFTKALIWWAYLVLASSLARREKEVPNGEIQVWQHRNPKLPKNPDREPWGRHWKALPDIETLFAHSPHPVSFSSGSFFTPLGQRIRHISVLELSRISFLVLKICLSSPVNHQKYLRAFSTRADSASSFAEILFAPITKSLVGPSFIQGLWDCLVLSKFFEQTSPKAIFFL